MADENLFGGAMDDMFVQDAGSSAPPADVQPAQPAPAAPVEQPAAPVALKDDGVPRQADGKFAPKEQAPNPAGTAQPSVEKPRVDPEQFKGYLDERDKRKAAETRVERLERELQEARATPAQIPSDLRDPQALAQYIQQQKVETIFDVSESMAREKLGDQPVTDAMTWAMERAQQSPAFAAEYLRQKQPIDWAVKQHKRDKTMNDIGDDVDAYVLRRAAELANGGAALPTQAAQPSSAASPQSPPVPATPPPPRSLAHATPAGATGSVPDGPFAPFDGLFKTG
jgi:hypothetical protein